MQFEGLPPTVNHMYRMHGRYKFKTSEARSYQERITAQIREVWQNKGIYTGRASLLIQFLTNNHKRWDIDNRVKAIQDCLNMAGVIGDDTQIDNLSVTRIYVKSDKQITRLLLMEAKGDDVC